MKLILSLLYNVSEIEDICLIVNSEKDLKNNTKSVFNQLPQLITRISMMIDFHWKQGDSRGREVPVSVICVQISYSVCSRLYYVVVDFVMRTTNGSVNNPQAAEQILIPPL